MRIGLFGGTFDPVHVGHLNAAHAARRILELDCVWLIPSHLPPHRAEPLASAAHRFAMVSLAVQGQEGILASDLEMDTPGPSYTTETLNRVEGLGIDLATTFFIIGADAFRDIAAWKGYPGVVDRCHFVVVSRPGVSAPSLRLALPDLSGRMFDAPCRTPNQPGILLLDVPTSAVSSTDVRRARASGGPTEGLVPVGVAAHMRYHGLYRAEAIY